MTVIQVLGRLRQEDGKFKSTLGYRMSSSQSVLPNETLSQTTTNNAETAT
jgi:hypothetical protein